MQQYFRGNNTVIPMIIDQVGKRINQMWQQLAPLGLQGEILRII